MDGLLNSLKHAVVDIALDALHLKDDTNTEGKLEEMVLSWVTGWLGLGVCLIFWNVSAFWFCLVLSGRRSMHVCWAGRITMYQGVQEDLERSNLTFLLVLCVVILWNLSEQHILLWKFRVKFQCRVWLFSGMRCCLVVGRMCSKGAACDTLESPNQVCRVRTFWNGRGFDLFGRFLHVC